MIYLYDAFWIFLFVLTGFLFHSTLNIDALYRFLITYCGTLVFWLLSAEMSSLRKKPFDIKGILLASLTTTPWSITIRSYLLQRTISPIFVFVMFAFFTIFAFTFRWVYSKIFK